MNFLELVKQQLLKIVEDIDTGNSNITEEQCGEIISLIEKYSIKDQLLSKYQACQYLNISRAKFDNLVRDGKIEKGIKRAGFKELGWKKSMLERIKSS